MVDAYALFFPIYTLFLSYATYLIFFQTEKVVHIINTLTNEKELTNSLESVYSDHSDEEDSNNTESHSDEENNNDEKKIDDEEKKDDEEEKELTPEEWAFEQFKKTDKYKFLTKYELNKLDKEVCDKEKKNNDVVIEYVPHMDSIIIMSYDFDNQYFSYWSDKVVPFYVLNIVAIKYVNEFNRSYLFLNEVEKVDETNDGVFVKTTNSEKKIENRYTQNHFKHKGKINELPLNLEKDKKVPKNIDFETFSKMFDPTEEEINLRRNRPDSL